jgi:hypothetical protein
VEQCLPSTNIQGRGCSPQNKGEKNNFSKIFNLNGKSRDTQMFHSSTFYFTTLKRGEICHFSVFLVKAILIANITLEYTN